jgi:hypothetical protein
MRRTRKLKKKFNAFVNQLSPDECREQLVLAYMQMERCQDVLRGEDVEPVEMEDNGLSSDLELFYLCKKVREELDSCDDDKPNRITFDVEFDTSSAVELIKDLRKEIGGLHKNITFDDLFKPDKKTIDAIKAWGRKNLGKKFRIGDEVWYMFGDKIQHGAIDYPMTDTDGVTIYMTMEGHTTAECETFRSLEELIEHLKSTTNEHYDK